MDEILLTVCLADERATQQTRTKSEQNHALNQQAGNFFLSKKQPFLYGSSCLVMTLLSYAEF